MSIDNKKTVSKKDVIDTAYCEFYTIEQLATKSGVSERSLRDAIRDNKLKATKKFTRWFILHNDFIDFLRLEVLSSIDKVKKSM